MIRRSLGVALWSLVGLLACFLGALNALVGTEAGRTLLARIASAAVQGAVSGTIQVGEVRGSLLTGVVLSDVRMWDPDSTLVAWLPHAELGYNLIDFAAGRIVFMEVRLDRPLINIVQHANGKTNFAELLRLDVKDTVKVRPLGPAGPRSLILLRNVQIDDGSLTLRLQKHGHASANEEVESSCCGSPRRAATRGSRSPMSRGASRSTATISTSICRACAFQGRSSARVVR